MSLEIILLLSFIGVSVAIVLREKKKYLTKRELEKQWALEDAKRERIRKQIALSKQIKPTPQRSNWYGYEYDVPQATRTNTSSSNSDDCHCNSDSSSCSSYD